jgi:hypothetical protein
MTWLETAPLDALPDSPRVKWIFLLSLLFSVVLAVASSRLFPESNLPVALAAIAAMLSFVELVCEVQEKRVRLVTSRALIAKSIRILLTITPLLLLRLLAPYEAQAKADEAEKTKSFTTTHAVRNAANAAKIIILESADARLEKRLRALERRH